ncbi:MULTISPECIES: RIP metalloprotease RseP [unclassified Dysgonomonas]|jgi:regulator of sigma E protease|uniref:RIP metalloprotease RseP n=1 Tax=unclassified Dysgonomonas TaxID=2630389 RepID=UPI0025BE769E|nr:MULTISPECIES: RIP metalloprotease RseP [unclassified Dysgonomonas]MDR2003829.1 RIP metalloprotease RseP [Prevotella sp.]HMM03267.1 RIP metalloprotease RseP [Dysgonomonas sp.]
METILIKALQLILSLSILVIIHEFGHFLFARLFKIRVEKFYLFFNPWFSLFKYKPKNSDTEYGIGWLPLGGYVKISGMIDESMDKEQMALPPQPWEFRSKPAWQRLLVMVGGVLFNFILAIIIFSMMLFVWGDEYLPLKNVKDGMVFSETVKRNGGFQDKDILVSADGKELVLGRGVLDMNTFMHFIDAKSVTIVRNGKQMELTLPESFADSVIASKQVAYEYWSAPVVDSVSENSEAKRIGLMRGDSITALDSQPITSQLGVQKYVTKISNKLGDNEKHTLAITFYRNGEVQTVSAAIDTSGVIGFTSPTKMADIFSKKNMHTDHYGFFESFPAGINNGVATLKGYVAQIRFVFSKEGVKNLSGFAGIGNMFPAQWNWYAFWSMTAFLSIVLAFMNILPIPALDGGHIMFLLYEAITKRQPNEKFMEYAQVGGMIFLLLLLLVANGNDIMRIFFK